MNLRNPATHIYIPKLKEMLKKVVFEMAAAAQTLWVYNQEVYVKEVEQKRLYVNFRVEVFLEGRWCQQIGRDVGVLRGELKGSGQARRRGEYN